MKKTFPAFAFGILFSASLPLDGLIAGQTNPATQAEAPTSMADLRGATNLDVERYRPHYPLQSCKKADLPTATPDQSLQFAMAHAEIYSDLKQGIGFIVMKDGKAIYQRYAEGVDGTTKTATASMMKSVLALLTGIAIDKGMIGSIDDPVGDYLEEWRDDPRGSISLRQLLTMSSGLSPSNFIEILLASDLGAAALKLKKVKAPDTEFSYNNAVSQLLSEILERRSKAAGYDGMADFLEKDLWCPLGNGEARLWTDTTGAPRGYAGLHAGLEDWARIGELIRNDGLVGSRQIVPKEWLAEMTKPSLTNPRYGLHIWLAGGWKPRRHYSAESPITVPHADPYRDKDLVFFDGFGGQRVYVIPSKGLTIARTGLTDLSYDDAIIPNMVSAATE